MRPADDAGLPDGGSACGDVTTNALHCGRCGAACSPGSACVDAGCALIDPEWANWPIPPEAPDSGVFTVTTETALDSQTGLLWQRALATTSMTRDEATAYCSALTLGGKSQWRLPTLMESLSIFTTQRYQGYTLDPAVFSRTDRVWTSSPANGHGNHGRAVAYSADPGAVVGAIDALDRLLDVRCVRFEQTVAATRRHGYVVDGGVVTDVATGLTWQRDAAAMPMVVNDAASYCAALDLQGAGWRLPTFRELASIIDVHQSAPTIDPAAFVVPGSPPFLWYFVTSTPASWPMPPFHVMNVDSNCGTVENRDATFANVVRCVR